LTQIVAGSEPSHTLDAEVLAPRLAIFDRADESGFITGSLSQGDRLRVQADRVPKTGWLAITPRPTAILWVAESSLDFEDRDPQDAAPGYAWIRPPGAVVRSGNPGAKLPGPPHGRFLPGTRVQIIDRPPVRLGETSPPTRWIAIVPPPDLAFYVRADGVRCLARLPGSPAIAEVRASFEQPAAQPSARAPKAGAPTEWPAEVAAELRRLDDLYRVILTSQPLERWHFETVRAGYQNLLKRSADRPDLDDALRTRLARLTRHEQAARAARSIEAILARSHRRDQDLALLKRELARREQASGRAFDAVGFVQPSARRVDGHKLFALIGAEGAAIAYLDVPPGLDPEPFLARRVGVRGQARFSADLGTRLISVRDLENLEARR
jgi:hypothetical protein